MDILLSFSKTNIFLVTSQCAKNITNHLCKKILILALDPGRGMTNKNFQTEDSDHVGRRVDSGSTVILFSLSYEAKLINFNYDTPK